MTDTDRWEWEQFYARTLPISFEIAGRAASDLPDGLRADGSGERLPAWAERTEDGLIRCTVCENEAYELPVEHDCIYANDLIADGGQPSTGSERSGGECVLPVCERDEARGSCYCKRHIRQGGRR